MSSASSNPSDQLPAIDATAARAIVEDSIKTYFRKRRSRVPRFVDETFSLSGALKNHAHAFGHDLWRAPLNVLFAVPQYGLGIVASALSRIGTKRTATWLGSQELLFRTSVSSAIERRIVVDLLELPYDGPGVPSHRDALALEILSHERLAGAFGALSGHWGGSERAKLEAKLSQQLAAYLNARSATGELVGAGVAAAAGGLFLRRFTPGFLTLGSALAETASSRAAGAIAAFLAGGGAIAVGAIVLAYAGLIADPVQRALGLHHARLVHLLDALESAFLGGDDRLRVPERYAARLVDLIDTVAAIARHARATA